MTTPVPYSMEAEQSVIGAMLRFGDAVDKIGRLDAKHFYREDHRKIYEQIMLMMTRGQAVDVVTVWNALQSKADMQMDGLLPYLNECAQSMPSSANVGYHAQIVVDHALLRAIMQTAGNLYDLAQNPKGKTPDQLLDLMQTMVGNLTERRTRTEARFISEILAEFVDGMARRADGLDSALSTGFEALDRMLNGGFRPEQLIIAAGRPSMGKTALSADIGLNISESTPVQMFSMEMSDQEVAGRALASRGNVHLSKVMGRINQHDEQAWSGVSHGCIRLQEHRFALDDTPAISLMEIRMRAKAFKRKHGLGLVIVDYIGLMSGGEGEKRTEQIGSYSRGLKAMAKELKVPVLALAQLSRKCEERPDKRPMLSDLRDSGEIEQDADVVMFVHRPEMYNPNDQALRGYAEVLIRKQRSGSLGDVPLLFDGPTCKFKEWQGGPPIAGGQKSGKGGRPSFIDD